MHKPSKQFASFGRCLIKYNFMLSGAAMWGEAGWSSYSGVRKQTRSDRVSNSSSDSGGSQSSHHQGSHGQKYFWENPTNIVFRTGSGRYKRVQQRVEKGSETGWSGSSKIFLKSEHCSRIEDCDDAFNFWVHSWKSSFICMINFCSKIFDIIMQFLFGFWLLYLLI